MPSLRDYLIIFAVILAFVVGGGLILYNFIWCRRNPEKCHELEKLRLQERIARRQKGSLLTFNM